MPTGRDARLVCAELIKAGFEASECETLDELVSGIGDGAGAVLIAEEALLDGTVSRLVETIGQQPVWSDIPILLFSSSSRNAESLLATLGSSFNITVVERPIRITMLISSVRGALRARERQYQTRDLLTQLEQADRQKDLFLATLSHELRTPLNSILGWIQIMRNEKMSEEDVDKAIRIIERNAKTQAEMIADILIVSRVITGKLDLRLESLNIRSIVQSAIDTIRPVAVEKSLSLIYRHDEYSPVPVEGDGERLQQVFLNLLTNAVKFTPEGGSVAIDLKRRGSNVEVSVSDTGQGISEKFLPFVFERFRQADSEYTRRTGGLGLGLAIVRSMVELHGGSVTAKSDGKDRGSTFTVTLPTAAAPRHSNFRPTGSDTGKMPAGSSLEGIRVLVVEDDRDSREMLKTILKHYGMETSAVETASEALDAFRSNPPDILISDVGLPNEDGYDLIRKIRSLRPEEGGLVPAIAMTGYVSLQDRSLAIAAGFQDHLPKPIETDILIELLGRLAEGRAKTAS